MTDARSRIVFVIPAKRESERAPGKNLALFGNTLGAAEAAASDWQDIIVSTDDEELSVRNVCGLIHRRDPALSEPDVSATTVTLAAINHYTVGDDDAVVQLLPTSPFRTEKHIEEALELYFSRDPGYSAVLSVTPVHRNAVCHETSDGLLARTELPIGFRDGQWSVPHPVYLSNGAIQITSAQLLRLHGDFWKIPKKIPYVMDEFAGFDVDSQAQLEMAQGLMGDH